MLHLNSFADWLTWAGLVIAIGSLAWSIFAYIALKRQELRDETFHRFFETLERVHNKGGSLIAQRGAIFELRNYPQYKDVILRICDAAPQLFGSGFSSVESEFNLTAEYLRKLG